MTEFTIEMARRLAKKLDCALELRFEGGDAEKMRDWLGDGIESVPQGTGELGERMTRAMQASFARGAEKAILIGADCPEISTDILQEAFGALSENDMTLGPSSDGGYYLIGLNASARTRALPPVFQGPAWGTDSVLETTRFLARKQGLSIHHLAELHDVDCAEDLPVWHAIRDAWKEQKTRPKISVIIPALNEAGYIGETLRSVKSACDIEIIVADGGSADDTIRIAESQGARVIQCEIGRAKQFNAAAELARGEFLLFLHADTRLPSGWERDIEETLAASEVAAGSFEFSTELDGIWMKMFTPIVNFRSRWLHLPYGDQGLFMKKATFETLNGFPDIPIMDDVEMVRRVKRLGEIVIVPSAVITSGRRWRSLGVWRTTALNQLCIVGHLLGIAPATIARWYKRDQDFH